MKKILILLLLFFSGTILFAQNDILYTKNGDVLVGEIKSMRKSVLTFDTNYADSEFKIDWSEVKGLIANGSLLIFTDDGSRYIGKLQPLLETDRLIRVITEDEEITMTLEDIVEVTALEKSFVQRIRILLDAGFSYTKANHAQTLSINGHVDYQANVWSFEGNFSKVGTYQDDVDETTRTEGTASFAYSILGKSFAFAGLQFLKNSEQLLNLRSTAKAGLGYYVVRTNHLYLGGGAGIAASIEDYGGDSPSSENNLEGLGILNFNAYDIGDLSVNTSFSYYPGITNGKRHRFDADFSLKYDLPFDFYIRLSYTHNFDSEPLVDVPKSDFVFQTTVGWEWN